MENPAWINDLFAAIDAMDSEKFASFITPDGTFRFGNPPAAVGREAIVGAVSWFFSSIKGLRHYNLHTWQDGDTMFVQGDVMYTRHDGSQIELSFLNKFGMKGNAIHEYRVFADVTPLYAPAPAEADAAAALN